MNSQKVEKSRFSVIARSVSDAAISCCIKEIQIASHVPAMTTNAAFFDFLRVRQG
ncbi:MAG: hypothetical protein ABIF71_03830 [Planctomycetota bacterium]